MVHNGILMETIGISVMVSIGLLLFFLALVLEVIPTPNFPLIISFFQLGKKL